MFTSNKAFFGNDVAGFQFKLVISNEDGSTLDNLYEISSGQNINNPIVINLIDFDGNIVTTDNTS
jgi:hypothetical protein